ncbi:MAG: DUF6671 family protein [Glaciecola sp.]
MTVASSNFVESHVALLTKHGKQIILEPVFFEAFNTQIVHTDAFDTDKLGAFDGSVERVLSPENAALKKAYLACELTGCNQGIGSEGSFVGHFGFGNINEEILAFVDVSKKIEVIARYKQPTSLLPISAESENELRAKLADFEPKQKWNVNIGQQWLKGLHADDVTSNVKKWPASIEPDFRAMHCPQRQQVIGITANSLVSRLQAICPKCDRVNFVPDHIEKGLPCELCMQPTAQALYYLCDCKGCGYQLKVNEVSGTASAFYCQHCNP